MELRVSHDAGVGVGEGEVADVDPVLLRQLILAVVGDRVDVLKLQNWISPHCAWVRLLEDRPAAGLGLSEGGVGGGECEEGVVGGHHGSFLLKNTNISKYES